METHLQNVSCIVLARLHVAIKRERARNTPCQRSGATVRVVSCVRTCACVLSQEVQGTS